MFGNLANPLLANPLLANPLTQLSPPSGRRLYPYGRRGRIRGGRRGKLCRSNRSVRYGPCNLWSYDDFDLGHAPPLNHPKIAPDALPTIGTEIGRASCRERV